MRALSQPRRGVVAQGSQALLSLEGLHVFPMHAHSRATEGHGGPGGFAKAAIAGRRHEGTVRCRLAGPTGGTRPTWFPWQLRARQSTERRETVRTQSHRL